VITPGDLSLQLKAIEGQEREYNHELADKRLLIGGRAERLIKLADDYRDQVKEGWDKLFTPSPTPEQIDLIFQFKKKLIQGLVTRVDVLEDKSVEVHTTFGLDDNASQPA
jgi:hypothetical protein